MRRTDGQKAGLAEGYLAGIPDENILALYANAVDEYDSRDVDQVLRCEPRQQEQAEHKGTYPDPGPWFADELQFLFVAFNQVHTFYLR